MNLGISGTYSSCKTITSMVLSHYTGIPRTRAKTMREILPDAAPGKTLEECTSSQLIQMIVVRHSDRCAHERLLDGNFVSDGSSLQEWIYGAVRVKVGINPNESASLESDASVDKTPELAYFEDVMSELGKAFKRHVRETFTAFVHLPNELPLSEDGHRPVNATFRDSSDRLLMQVMGEIDMPYTVIGGSLGERAERIAQHFRLPVVMSVEEAIAAAEREYGAMDVRSETQRSA